MSQKAVQGQVAPLGQALLDFFVQAGITTAWSRGAGEDVLTVSWVPAALTEEPMAVLQVAAEDGFWLSSTYPDWPLDPATSIAVRDVPELPGLDPADAVGMGTIIEASYPEWGSIMSVNAYFSDGFGAFAQNVRWSVLIPPEGASFSFDSLPFPASADLEAVFPSAISDYRLGIAAIESTEDPWIDYVGWTEENWWEDRFVARTVDGRRAFEP